MLQPKAASCAVCGAEVMLALPREIDRITRPTIEGLALLEQQPPTGLRDMVELCTVGILTIGTGALGMLGAGHPLGVFAGALPFALGYWQQRRRPALRRRQRVRAVAEPAGIGAGGDRVTIRGIAHPLDAAIRSEMTASACVTASLVVRRDAGGALLLWRADAADFWVVPDDGGERVLVRGARWIAGDADHSSEQVPEFLTRSTGLAVDDGWVEERRVAIGEPISVTGIVDSEMVPEIGGYRDSVVRVLRAEPRHVVRIARAVP